MYYISDYQSPLGEMLLIADEKHLMGLYFEKESAEADFCAVTKIPDYSRERNDALPIIRQTKKWLDAYFRGEKTDAGEIALRLEGTEFQKEVWNILLNIPYGKTVCYMDIAEQMARKRGLLRMSAQAVGGAVSKNPLSIIVPCHRVIGKNGRLTGYAAGLDRKERLLRLEGLL